jgi:hypothetical protein
MEQLLENLKRLAVNLVADLKLSALWNSECFDFGMLMLTVDFAH